MRFSSALLYVVLVVFSFSCSKDEASKKNSAKKSCPSPTAQNQNVNNGTQNNMNTSSVQNTSTSTSTNTSMQTTLALAAEPPAFSKVTELLNKHYDQCEGYTPTPGTVKCGDHATVSADYDKILGDLLKDAEDVPVADYELLFLYRAAGKPAPLGTSTATNTATSTSNDTFDQQQQQQYPNNTGSDANPCP